MKLYTTNPKSMVEYRRPWLDYRADWKLDPGQVWAFSDGSSTGWHAATVLTVGKEILRVNRHREPGETKNVAIELHGAALALESLPEGIREAFLVFDYLGIGAWLTGAWKIYKSEIGSLVEALFRLIEQRKLELTLIHQAGHVSGFDPRTLSYWNKVTDRASRAGYPVELLGLFPWPDRFDRKFWYPPLSRIKKAVAK